MITVIIGSESNDPAAADPEIDAAGRQTSAGAPSPFPKPCGDGAQDQIIIRIM